MRALFRSLIIASIALFVAVPATLAQDRVAYRQAELDQMLAPIALYPDSILSQILMAATYPIEVVQAARWSRANPQLSGQDAVAAVEHLDWDPSVKSLVAFPRILSMMDDKLDWTQRLGEAFLAQQAQVMDTIQDLRRRAEAAGNLRSNDNYRVIDRDRTIVIEPAHPEIVYVPYYDPTYVYGSWWWPAYPPVYWGPPPGYYYTPAFGSAFLWGAGVRVSAGFFFGFLDWRHRDVRVVNVHRYPRDVHVSKPAIIALPPNPVVWRHDPAHRRGVPYRHEGLRHEFGRTRTPGSEVRRESPDPVASPPIDRSPDIRRSQDRRLEERPDRGERAGPREHAPARQEQRQPGRRQEDRRGAVPDAGRVYPDRTAAESMPGRPEPRVESPRPDVRSGPLPNREPRSVQIENPALRYGNARAEPREEVSRPDTRRLEPRSGANAPTSRPAGAPASVESQARQNSPSDGSARPQGTRGGIHREQPIGNRSANAATPSHPPVASGNAAPRTERRDQVRGKGSRSGHDGATRP